MTEALPVDARTSFELENPYLKGWLDEQALELSGNVPATTTEALRESLSEGIRAGEGVPALKKRVGGVYEAARGHRAELIARTEANKAANGASWAQAKGSGVVKTKTWMATMDSRTRATHAAMNGETVGLDEPFSNGEMFPSSPNCRCAISYGIDESLLAEDSGEPEEAALEYRQLSPQEVRAYGDESFDDWSKTLTAQERQDLLDYQNGPYGDLNHWLRTGEELPEDIFEEYTAWRDNLDSAIEKGSAPENLSVYRGFENPEISRNFDALDGTIIGDDGYVSTSLSEPVASRFTRGYEDPILAEIRLPKGAKMAYVDKVNSVDEFEAILPRGTRFRVAETGYDERGRKRLVLEVVGG